MAQDIPVYNAMDVSISINGRVIQGFQENDMFSAQYKEDQSGQMWMHKAHHQWQLTITT